MVSVPVERSLYANTTSHWQLQSCVEYDFALMDTPTEQSPWLSGGFWMSSTICLALLLTCDLHGPHSFTQFVCGSRRKTSSARLFTPQIIHYWCENAVENDRQTDKSFGLHKQPSAGRGSGSYLKNSAVDILLSVGAWWKGPMMKRGEGRGAWGGWNTLKHGELIHVTWQSQ